jgi:hypothetical protein
MSDDIVAAYGHIISTDVRIINDDNVVAAYGHIISTDVRIINDDNVVVDVHITSQDKNWRW